MARGFLSVSRASLFYYGSQVVRIVVVAGMYPCRAKAVLSDPATVSAASTITGIPGCSLSISGARVIVEARRNPFTASEIHKKWISPVYGVDFHRRRPFTSGILYPLREEDSGAC